MSSPVQNHVTTLSEKRFPHSLYVQKVIVLVKNVNGRGLIIEEYLTPWSCSLLCLLSLSSTCAREFSGKLFLTAYLTFKRAFNTFTSNTLQSYSMTHHMLNNHLEGL